MLIFSLIVSNVSSPYPRLVCGGFPFLFGEESSICFFVMLFFVVYHELSDFQIVCLVRDFLFPLGNYAVYEFGFRFCSVVAAQNINCMEETVQITAESRSSCS